MAIAGGADVGMWGPAHPRASLSPHPNRIGYWGKADVPAAPVPAPRFREDDRRLRVAHRSTWAPPSDLPPPWPKVSRFSGLQLPVSGSSFFHVGGATDEGGPV